jgi:hypothetical protein
MVRLSGREMKTDDETRTPRTTPGFVLPMHEPSLIAPAACSWNAELPFVLVGN